jgi:hypothetical protein
MTENGYSAPKERPILFSADMVRAIIAGRKTQTRRLVKTNSAGRAQLAGRNWHLQDPDCIKACPYGRPGDILWVREAFSGPHCMESSDGCAAAPPSKWAKSSRLWFWADGDPQHGDWTKPRPPIHMPRWASRITLRVTDVRVERLQDITADDAAAEGVQIPVDASTGRPMLDISSPYAPCHYLTADKARTFDHDAWLRAHFAGLWDSINAKRGHGWASNPFVWSIGFEMQA